MEEAIKKAIEGGYLKALNDITGLPSDFLNESAVLLDPLFWQALGKAEGWIYPVGGMNGLREWHKFIDHLAEGKDAESFFTNLLEIESK